MASGAIASNRLQTDNLAFGAASVDSTETMARDEPFFVGAKNGTYVERQP